MCCKCSTQVLSKIRMSSKYMTIKEIVNGCNISSIILINVGVALVNPKGVTNHLKIPSLDFKVAFHTLTS